MFPEPLKEAIELINRGQLERAKIILEQALEVNPQDEHAWLWLAECESDPRRKRYCYQRVLRVNPAHMLARQRLAELRSAVAAPSLDEVFSVAEGRLTPTLESAQKARSILIHSRSEGDVMPDDATAPTASAGMENAVRCPSCHAGYLHPHEIMHHSSLVRTLSASLAVGLAALFIAAIALVIQGSAKGVLFSLNDWFYHQPLQPAVILLGASAGAFVFFRFYFNRRQRVLRCSSCQRLFRYNKKKPAPLSGNR